jgi:hypothetical protein
MEYSHKYLHEFARMVDSQSILVVDSRGKLRRIFCPFPVVSLTEAFNFEKGQLLSVEAVKVTTGLQDVFIIGGKAYLIQYFGIIAQD